MSEEPRLINSLRVALSAAPDDVPLRLHLAELLTRLRALVIMAIIWAFGAWRRYRRLRAGVRLPWTERAVPQVLFRTGLLAALSTIWFDRRKIG